MDKAPNSPLNSSGLSCKKEQMKSGNLIKLFLGYLGSGKLALVLVAILIVFSLVGVLFPQEGQLSTKDILQWQQQHASITAVLKPLGFFAVFHSWPFMVTIGLLAVNTLTCTLTHFAERGGFRALTRPGAMIPIGFVVLHLAFIGLLAGGFISAATRMDGYIVLTEGQRFTDRPENYLRYSIGSLRPEGSRDFSVLLKEVEVAFEKSDYVVDVKTVLQFQSQQDRIFEGIVKINQPFDYEGLTFTLDETGYSPRLVICQEGKQAQLVNSFIALQTFTTSQGRQYRDYLPIPFFENRINLEFYPAGSKDGQTGGILTEPVMFVKAEDSNGAISTTSRLQLGQKTVADGFEFEFAELRQWAAFRVSNDPGYPVVWTSLWLGLVAVLLRYLPELREWKAKPIGHIES
ncbi:MAG: cytochrome c biogenesis protein ResB [Planctomycetota bacterium]